MKYLFIICLFLLSCGELMPSDGRYVVINVSPYDKGKYKYQLTSVKGKDAIWMVDSSSKYVVGDTLTIKK